MARPTPPMLCEAGERLGFEVDVVRAGADRRRAGEQQRRCARRSRAAILSRRERLLGRPYSMIGRVVLGEQLGRRPRVPHGEPAAGSASARRSGHFRGARARHRRAAERCPAWRASARGPRWAAPCRCSRRMCSISAATCTAARSKWSSWRSCATSEHFASLDALVEQMNLDAAQARADLERVRRLSG